MLCDPNVVVRGHGSYWHLRKNGSSLQG